MHPEYLSLDGKVIHAARTHSKDQQSSSSGNNSKLANVQHNACCTLSMVVLHRSRVAVWSMHLRCSSTRPAAIVDDGQEVQTKGNLTRLDAPEILFLSWGICIWQMAPCTTVCALPAAGNPSVARNMYASIFKAFKSRSQDFDMPGSC